MDSTDLERIREEIAEHRARLAELTRLARQLRQGGPPNKLKLTKSAVRNLPIPLDRATVFWDSETTGLGVRVSPTGSRVYFLQCRCRNGRSIKLTIGRADRITAEQAREAARQHLAAIQLGRDPAAELRQQRQAERERRLAQTVDALWLDYQRDHLAKKRPATISNYSTWFRLHIRPQIGRAKLVDLTRAHGERLHRAATEAAGASTANRALAVASSMLTYALDRGLIATHPFRGIRRHQEPGRERVLSDDELRRLIAHLAASGAVEARLCELAISTGARRGELLSMRWDDLRDGWWIKPAHLTKGKKTHRVPLNQSALAVLGQVERRGSLVFQGVTESRLSKWWCRERERIKLDGVRIHDLRHAAASMAISAGMPLASVSKLLGHGVHSAAMTAKYSHISDQALAEASAAVAQQLARLRKEPPAGSA